MIKAVAAILAEILQDAWTRIEAYPQPGEAHIAEATLGGRRLIVRRIRVLGIQDELFPTWAHYPFLTNRDEDTAVVEDEHRHHAVAERVIRDLRDQALAHFPSGHYHADAAWTVIAALSHNLRCWTAILRTPEDVIRAARTTRRRLLTLPGRLTRHANQ